jgi:hypothetical protein
VACRLADPRGAVTALSQTWTRGAGRFWSGAARTTAAARSAWTPGDGRRSDRGWPRETTPNRSSKPTVSARSISRG